MSQMQDDEIDLFELFQTLWDGIWLISVCVILTTLVGFGYSQLAQPKYKVSAIYTINSYPVLGQQICESSYSKRADCYVEGILKSVNSMSPSWSANAKSPIISLTTFTPLPSEDYEISLKNTSLQLTTLVREEAETELASIEGASNSSLYGTERFATNMLNAKRVIHIVDSGKDIISFGSVSVNKVPSKVPIVLALSVVLGGMIGVFFILIRSAFRKRKVQLADA